MVLKQKTSGIYLYILHINPFTAPVCDISGLKSAHTSLQTAYSLVLQHMFSVLRVLIKFCSHADAKNIKRVEDFKFCTFMGHFQVTLAVTELRERFQKEQP